MNRHSFSWPNWIKIWIMKFWQFYVTIEITSSKWFWNIKKWENRKIGSHLIIKKRMLKIELLKKHFS